METYQPIYDAVRSRLSNCDIGCAVENAIRSEGFSAYFQNAMVTMTDEIWSVGAEQKRPSVLFRPKLTMDGNQWCAMYGENPMEGICGFGNTPELAMKNFDENWRNDDISGSNKKRETV